MGISKQFLALAVTFLCFVAGLFYLFDTLRDLDRIESMKITWVMEDTSNANVEVMEDEPISGSRIVALCMLPLDCEVKLNGNKVVTGSSAVTTVVDIQKKYWLKREYKENFSKPKVLISEYIEE